MRSPGGPAPYLRPAHSVIEPAPTSHGPARAWRDAEPVLDLDERTWQDMIDVNLTGMAHPQAAVPHIRAVGRGGSVIITSSGAALMPPPGIGHYNASTAGVVALARTLAQEVGLEPDPRQLRQPRQRGHADDR